jgi:hypothetical protein
MISRLSHYGHPKSTVTHFLWEDLIVLLYDMISYGNQVMHLPHREMRPFSLLHCESTCSTLAVNDALHVEHLHMRRSAFQKRAALRAQTEGRRGQVWAVGWMLQNLSPTAMQPLTYACSSLRSVTVVQEHYMHPVSAVLDVCVGLLTSISSLFDYSELRNGLPCLQPHQHFGWLPTRKQWPAAPPHNTFIHVYGASMSKSGDRCHLQVHVWTLHSTKLVSTSLASEESYCN